MKHDLEPLVRWLGHRMPPGGWVALERYRRWLENEALPAGGIGPGEVDRLVQRHIGDSLAYAAGFEASPPPQVVDYGTGVGLPGIPLAILWPGCEMTLADRSGRRVELLRRAVRVLDLANIDVVQRDATSDVSRYPAVITRAVFPPSEWVEIMQRLLAPGGRAVTSLGGGDVPKPGTIARSDVTLSTLQLPVEMLDHRVRLLIMSRTGGESDGHIE